ncbi:MAG: hypothetical protein FJX72_11150, partial [Armatimonadetes bacterium]|nr:hypothetical protein [Armatimonadota bacterium]
MDIAALAIALAGGAVGNAVGKSPVTGSQPWNKVLAPALAALFPVVYKLAGGNMSFEEASAAGVTIGATAVGVYSAGKN